ncbi:Polyketide synthase PksM [Sutcliffiella rhizosphaerae]|uniref:Polyketide synthase PksM n=2 Tax=Sutcliffiella rhizosphaerae TaxID=2880967 RepID=A0ABN8AGL4_9BACI|nr:Polyketide synthase PksM [Sutcliffiella rhizosphaerae]
MLGALPEFFPSVRWAFEFLSQEGYLKKAEDKYHVVNQSKSIKDNKNVDFKGIRNSINMIDYVLENWLDVIRGKVNPVYLFFNVKGQTLWEEYFNNSNQLYEIHNRWLSAYLSDLISEKDNVLELGSGYGSTTKTILQTYEEKKIQNFSYLATDISQILLKKLKNANESNQLSTKILNFDNVNVQVLEKYDFIIATNALHCAVNLIETLKSLKESLKETGKIILSESIRDTNSYLHQEFIFNLLPGYKYKEEEIFLMRGFLTKTEWEHSLFMAGYNNIKVYENNNGPIIAGLIVGEKM